MSTNLCYKNADVHVLLLTKYLRHVMITSGWLPTSYVRTSMHFGPPPPSMLVEHCVRPQVALFARSRFLHFVCFELVLLLYGNNEAKTS